MRKLELSFVAMLAAGALLVGCSDDSGDNKDMGGDITQFDGGTPDQGPKDDTNIVTPDADTTPTCDPAYVGKYCEFKACATDTDCTGIGTGKCSGGFCENVPCGDTNTCLTLGTETDGTRWGICTCSCTPDDSSTPLVVEDTCPDLSKNGCSSAIEVTAGSCTSDADCAPLGADFKCQGGRCAGSRAYCLAKCDPTIGTNTCDGKLACDPRAGATFGFFDEAICARKGCAADDDCPVILSTTCDTKTDTGCGTGETCELQDARGTCTADTDCDTNYHCKDLGGQKYCVHNEGVCSTPGKCDTVSGLCDSKPATLSKAGAKIGDACVDDTECDVNQFCLREMDMSKWMKKKGETCADDAECCSNNCTGGTCGDGGLCTIRYRNGYCAVRGCAFASTLTIRDCGAEGDCNVMYSGGYCQKTCDLTDASTCRGNPNDLLGDYECRAWNNLSLGGVPAASVPTCDFGKGTPCDTFGTSSNVTCESLGDVGDPNATPPVPANSTNMKCRTLDGTPTANGQDPNGYCLDDTASGTQVRSPLPTP